MTTKLSDHPLSAPFKAGIGTAHPDLLEASYETLDAEREGLKRLSTARHAFRAPTPKEPLARGGTLTMTEAARLSALDAVMNVHHGISFLQGRPLSDFGFEGVDQVHGRQWAAPCGCVLLHVFDHNDRENPEREHHPHYPRLRCERHAAVGDFRALHAQVVADNAE